MSEDARDLIIRFLNHEPTKRLGYSSIEEIKRHPFFSNLDWEALLAREIQPPIVPILRGREDSSYFHKVKIILFSYRKPNERIEFDSYERSVEKNFDEFTYIAKNIDLSTIEEEY